MTSDGAHLRLHLPERDGRAQPTHDKPCVSATSALSARATLGHRVWLPHVCIELRDLEVHRENADDPGRQAVQHDSRADRMSRAAETRLPEAMADEDWPQRRCGV